MDNVKYSRRPGTRRLIQLYSALLHNAHLKGFMTAPWAKAISLEMPKVAEGIRLFAEAKRKHFPGL